jgi:metal-sulfur cluster biosynthetic enzyme
MGVLPGKRRAGSVSEVEAQSGAFLPLPGSVQAAADEDALTQALREVYDPELGMSVVDLGLVYEARVEDGTASVRMTLTSMGCPAGPQLMQEVEEAACGVPGVEEARVELVWSPAWNPTMMSEDAKLELGYL